MRLKKNEFQECCAFFEYCDIMANSDWRWGMIFHVPNGEYRHQRTAGRLKAMGTRPGVPDYLIDVACGGYHGMRLEMKVKGGRVRPEQMMWLARYQQADYHPIICYTADEAIDSVQKYFALKPGQRFDRCQVLTSVPSNVIPLRR